ncbi:MAG: hypothetical protein Q3997_08645 [Propionibacteriaceae bacterium]|nr:hypothetical protein [Propionibacteriaceae bacterium]
MTSPTCTRRALLAGGASLLTGCALTDPVIRPSGAIPRGPRPQYDAHQATASATERKLAAWWLAIEAAAPGWPEAATVAPVAASKAAAHAAHVARLQGADVLLLDDRPRHPSPTEPPVTVSSWADAQARVKKIQSHAVTSYHTAALALAGSQPALALFYASLAACASASPTLALSGGDAAPRPFIAGTPAAAREVLLTRVWALVYALETGIGRFPRGAEPREAGLARLAEAKLLRDELLAHPGLASPPQQRSDYDLGGPLNTDQEVLAGWARAELAVLGAWGRLAAVSRDDPRPLDAMLAQVPQVERWGQGLPTWPGWA